MYNSETKYIKDWNELKHIQSQTHILKIDEDYGCGWIISKDNNRKHYLSTHTFYDGTNEHYTKKLQECGFNIILKSWDKINL